MSWALCCCLTEIVDSPGKHPCPLCGKQVKAYECGLPVRAQGVPAVQTYKPRMICGKLATSRRQEDKIHADKGLVTVTQREARDSCPPPDTKRFPTRGQT